MILPASTASFDAVKPCPVKWKLGESFANASDSQHLLAYLDGESSEGE